MTRPPSLRSRLLEPQGLFNGALFRDLLLNRFAGDAPQPGERFGAFRIVRELGRGGMGVVWLAERADGEFAQSVALKWLPDAATSSDSAALFLRERQFLAELSHPNIARLIDGGRTESGHLWFAMEYIEGLPVDRHVDSHGLGERARAALMLQVVEAVQFAHGRLLIHRDIKPGNVMVDSHGRPTLLDFGIAGFAQESEAVPAFTPAYASPEQRALQPVGTASDIWQLGRLLEAVLRIGGREIGADLRAIVAKATADDPAARYASAASLRGELQRFLDGRPVMARDGGWTYRFSLLARRHPLGTFATVLTLVSALSLVAGFLRYASVERERLRNARDETVAINRFLNEDVLGASDPFYGVGNDEQMSDLLESSLKKAELRFAQHPSIAGRILMTIGGSLLNRGRYDSAEQATERAIVLLRKAPDPDVVAIGEARLTLALVDMYRGNYIGSQSRLEDLEREFPFERKTPEPLEWRIQSELAWNALLLNRYAECAARYRKVVAQPMGIDERELSYAYTGLSTCESALGRYEDALRYAKQAEHLAIATSGQRSGTAVLARISIAGALAGLGRQAEAIQLLRKEVDELTELLGPRHPTAISHVSLLGAAYLCANDNVAAAQWLKRAYEGRLRTVGADHPWTIITRSQYATALLRSGDAERAAIAMAEIEQYRLQPEEIVAQSWVHRALGEWHLREARSEKAIPRYFLAREIALKPGMRVRANLHAVEAGLGLSLSWTGRTEEAMHAYERMESAVRDSGHCTSPLTVDAEADRRRLLAVFASRNQAATR